jgi:hypothetical protein
MGQKNRVGQQTHRARMAAAIKSGHVDPDILERHTLGDVGEKIDKYMAQYEDASANYDRVLQALGYRDPAAARARSLREWYKTNLRYWQVVHRVLRTGRNDAGPWSQPDPAPGRRGR